MLSTINWIYAILTTSLSGTILFGMWWLTFGRFKLNNVTALGYLLLHVICLFFLVPVAFGVIALITMVYDPWLGRLFIATPMTVILCLILSVFWIGGVVIRLLMFTRTQWKMRRLIKRAQDCNEKEIQIFEDMCCEMKIHVGRVRLRKSHEIAIPCIVGLFRPTVLLSAQDFTKDQLRMVYCHELTHYKQRNLWLKALCVTVAIIHFYNPIVYVLRGAIEAWSEYYCDERAIARVGTTQEYFGAILDVAVQQGEVPTLGLSAKKSAYNLEQRVNYMMSRGGKGKLRQSVFAGMLAFLLCVVTVISVTTVTAYAYEGLFEVTKVERSEESKHKELVEYIEYARSGVLMAEEQEVVPLAEGTFGFNWNLPDAHIGKTDLFYAKKEGTITVTAIISPADAKVKVGIVEPSGTMRYVQGTDTIFHQFALDETGYYRVYVDNITTNNVEINATGTYIVVYP